MTIASKENPVIYVCAAHAGFFFTLHKVKYRFTQHELKITDPEQEKAIDELIEKNEIFQRKIKKVDKAEAEKLVAEHQARHGGAHKGPITAQAILNSQKVTTQADAALAGMADEDAAKLQEKMKEDSDLILTESTKQQHSSVENNIPEATKSGLKLTPSSK